MSGFTYDTGALLAAERGDQRMAAHHRRILESGRIPVVPAGVLAQAWRGGPQPRLSKLLAGCRVEPLDEPLARSTGATLAMTGTSDVIDASVALGAAIRDDIVITSDPGDIQRLAAALNLRLETVTV